MHDLITIRGTVGSEPRHYVSPTGVAVTTFRVASNHRVRDQETGEWVDGTTNWYSVTAFRQLAEHTVRSLRKGQRVIVQGRLKIRNWTAGEKSGTSIDLDADTVGHDLAYGRSDFIRVYQGAPGEAAGASAVAGEAAGAPPAGGVPARDDVDGIATDARELDDLSDAEAYVDGFDGADVLEAVLGGVREVRGTESAHRA